MNSSDSETAAAYRRAFGIPNANTTITAITHASHSQRQLPTNFVSTVLDTNIGYTPHVPPHERQHHVQNPRQYEHEQLRQSRQREQHQSSSSSSSSLESPSPVNFVAPFRQEGPEFYQQHAQAGAKARILSYPLPLGPSHWPEDGQGQPQRLNSHPALSLQQLQARQHQFEHQQLIQAYESPCTTPHDVHVPSDTGKNPSAPPVPPPSNSSSSRPSSYFGDVSISKHDQRYVHPSSSASPQGSAMAPPSVPRPSSSKSSGVTYSPSSSSSSFRSYPIHLQGKRSVPISVGTRNIQTQLVPHTENQRSKKTASDQVQATTPPLTMITTEELEAHLQAHRRHQGRMQRKFQAEQPRAQQHQHERDSQQATSATPPLSSPLPKPYLQNGTISPVRLPRARPVPVAFAPPVPPLPTGASMAIAARVLPTFGSVVPSALTSPTVTTPTSATSAASTPLSSALIKAPAPTATNFDPFISSSADGAFLPLRLGIESLLGDTTAQVKGAMEKMREDFVKQAGNVRLQARVAMEEKKKAEEALASALEEREMAVKDCRRHRKEKERVVAELKKEKEEKAIEGTSQETVLEKATQRFERERALVKQRETFLMGLFPDWQREKAVEMLKEWEEQKGRAGEDAVMMVEDGNENRAERNENENELLRRENEKLKKENTDLRTHLLKVAKFFAAYKDDFVALMDERNKREQETGSVLAMNASSSSQGLRQEVTARESGGETPTQEDVMGYMATVLDVVGEKVTRQVDIRLEVVLKEIEEQKMLREKAEKERDEFKAAHAHTGSHSDTNNNNTPSSSSSSTLLKGVASSRSSTPAPPPTSSTNAQSNLLQYTDSRPVPSDAETLDLGPGVDVNIIDLCSSPPLISAQENVPANAVDVDVEREEEEQVEYEIEQEEEDWLERSFNSNRNEPGTPASETGHSHRSQSQSMNQGMDREEEEEMSVRVKLEPDIKMEEKPNVIIDFGVATSTSGDESNSPNDTIFSSSRTGIPLLREFSQPPPMLSLPTPAADSASDRVHSPPPSASSSPYPSNSDTALISTSNLRPVHKRKRAEYQMDHTNPNQRREEEDLVPATCVKIERVDDDEDACDVQLDEEGSSPTTVIGRFKSISSFRALTTNSNSILPGTLARFDPCPPMAISHSIQSLEEGEMTPTPTPTPALPAAIRSFASNLEEGEMTPTPATTPVITPLLISLPATSAPMPVALQGDSVSRGVGRVSPMRSKTRSRHHTALSATAPPYSTTSTTATVNSGSGSRLPEREVRKRKMVNHGLPAPITANQAPPVKKVKHSWVYEPVA